MYSLPELDQLVRKRLRRLKKQDQPHLGVAISVTVKLSAARLQICAGRRRLLPSPQKPFYKY